MRPSRSAGSTRSPIRAVLQGPTQILDRRVNAYRPDLADLALADRVIAAHYAAPVLLECRAESVPLVAQPRAGAIACSELLHGEQFHALEIASDWVWGWCEHDHYVGYVPAAALREPGPAATHRVVARNALVFAEPSIRAPLECRLPLGARVASEGMEGGFWALERGYVHPRHLAPLGEYARDPVEVAGRLIGAPYLWGGRTGAGVDCSGLVQVALMLCGMPCPRDSDQQRALGEPVEPGAYRRGDLVFFPGHVGLMVDGENLLHANAHWMGTVIEPLDHVVDRLRPAHPEPIAAVRRPA